MRSNCSLPRPNFASGVACHRRIRRKIIPLEEEAGIEDGAFGAFGDNNLLDAKDENGTVDVEKASLKDAATTTTVRNA